MTAKPKTPHEIVARTLCRCAGNPEDTEFEGQSMWESYLPLAAAVIAAITEAGFLAREDDRGKP